MKILTPTEQQIFEENRRNSMRSPKPTTIFSKYQLVNAIKKYDEDSGTDLYSTLTQAYAANSEFQFYWNTVLQLDMQNEDFQRFISAFGLTAEQIAGIVQRIKTL